MAGYTYVAEASIWQSGSSKLTWKGEATIGVRADSKAGLRILEEKVSRVATAWARNSHGIHTGVTVHLEEWGPKALRR